MNVQYPDIHRSLSDVIMKEIDNSSASLDSSSIAYQIASSILAKYSIGENPTLTLNQQAIPDHVFMSINQNETVLDFAYYAMDEALMLGFPLEKSELLKRRIAFFISHHFGGKVVCFPRYGENDSGNSPFAKLRREFFDSISSFSLSAASFPSRTVKEMYKTNIIERMKREFAGQTVSIPFDVRCQREIRNNLIYTDYLNGKNTIELSSRYNMSDRNIRRIIKEAQKTK